MNLLEQLENKIEKLVEGLLINTASSKLEPIEIARRLKKEMESSRLLSVSKTYVNNDYEIIVSPEDYGFLDNLGRAFFDELVDFLKAAARENNYNFVSPPTVLLVKSNLTKKGSFEISSKNTAKKPESKITQPKIDSTQIFKPQNETAFLETAEGKKFNLVKDPKGIIIGRSRSSDIFVPSPKISRNHAKISFDGSFFLIEDLNSTNGTFINDNKISKSKLNNGDKIKLANEIIFFRETI